MGRIICCPQTFLGHENQKAIRTELSLILANPARGPLASTAVELLKLYPLPISDFPALSGTYSRTIVVRGENGFECMAARWTMGAVSSIHGHPDFTLYYVMKGVLEIQNYRQSAGTLKKSEKEILREGDHCVLMGRQGAFDNNIHQVKAIEETLSIHISSDDSAKGVVFTGS